MMQMSNDCFPKQVNLHLGIICFQSRPENFPLTATEKYHVRSKTMDYERVIFGIIAVVALLNNALTVTLFVKKSKWLKKTYNCLILALAIQDILAAISLMVLPGFVMKEGIYGEPASPKLWSVYCKILWSHFIPFALGIASVYTCLMLTFERWMAVVRPFLYKKYEQSFTMVSVAVLFPWIAGFCFELATPLNATLLAVNGTYYCGWKEMEYSWETACVAVFMFLGMIVIPAALMVLAYWSIIVHIKQSQQRVAATSNSNAMTRGIKQVTATAIFASILVIVCWLPDQIYYTLSQLQLTKLGTTEHFIVKTLAFASSCVNPIIYCFSNKSYRNALKDICRPRKQLGDRRGTTA